MSYPRPVRIVMGFDGGYAAQAGVALSSLRANNPGKIDIHLLCSGVPEVDLARFRGLGAHIHDIDVRRWSGFQTLKGISLAAYNRLLMAEFLPSEVDKVLYLDCDVVVDGNLAPLWDLDLSDVVAAAGDDPNMQRERFATLGLGEDHVYFNSGLLLVNLGAWRRERVAERAVDFLRAHGDKAVLLDQDALNVALEGRVRRLSARWNFMPYLEGSKRHLDNPAIASGTVNPAIIHYAGTCKPWHKTGTSDHFSRLYWRYWWSSPWAPPPSG